MFRYVYFGIRSRSNLDSLIASIWQVRSPLDFLCMTGTCCTCIMAFIEGVISGRPVVGLGPAKTCASPLVPPPGAAAVVAKH